MDTWVASAIIGLLLAGFKGFWLKKTAVQVGKPQHVHFISTLTTVLISGILTAINQPMTPNIKWYWGLCLIGGIVYTLSSILSISAQKYLGLSLYNSSAKLATFLPILFFYFIIGEKPTFTQWIGIIATTFPLLMVSLAARKSAENQEYLKGLPLLVGVISGFSALHILNKLAMTPEFHIDEILFILGINLISIPTGIAAIVIKKERVQLEPVLIRHGIIAGILNISSFGFYLHALSIGPASVIVPLNSLHILISVALTEKYQSKRKKVIMLILLLWAIISVVLLAYGES